MATIWKLKATYNRATDELVIRDREVIVWSFASSEASKNRFLGDAKDYGNKVHFTVDSEACLKKLKEEFPTLVNENVDIVEDKLVINDIGTLTNSIKNAYKAQLKDLTDKAVDAFCKKSEEFPSDKGSKTTIDGSRRDLSKKKLEADREAVSKIVDETTVPREIVVYGGFSSGKSCLLNDVIGKNLFPSRQQECTRFVCRIRNPRGEETPKVLVTRDNGNEEVSEYPLSKKSMTDINVSDESLRSIEVITPIENLNKSRDYILYDTPGVMGMLFTPNKESVLKRVIEEDGVVLMIADLSGKEELHRTKEAFKNAIECYRQAGKDANFMKNNVLLVVTKADSVSKEDYNKKLDEPLFENVSIRDFPVDNVIYISSKPKQDRTSDCLLDALADGESQLSKLCMKIDAWPIHHYEKSLKKTIKANIINWASKHSIQKVIVLDGDDNERIIDNLEKIKDEYLDEINPDGTDESKKGSFRDSFAKKERKIDLNSWKKRSYERNLKKELQEEIKKIAAKQNMLKRSLFFGQMIVLNSDAAIRMIINDASKYISDKVIERFGSKNESGILRKIQDKHIFSELLRDVEKEISRKAMANGGLISFEDASIAGVDYTVPKEKEDLFFEQCKEIGKMFDYKKSDAISISAFVKQFSEKIHAYLTDRELQFRKFVERQYYEWSKSVLEVAIQNARPANTVDQAFIGAHNNLLNDYGNVNFQEGDK